MSVCVCVCVYSTEVVYIQPGAAPAVASLYQHTHTQHTHLKYVLSHIVRIQTVSGQILGTELMFYDLLLSGLVT